MNLGIIILSRNLDNWINAKRYSGKLDCDITVINLGEKSEGMYTSDIPMFHLGIISSNEHEQNIPIYDRFISAFYELTYDKRFIEFCNHNDMICVELSMLHECWVLSKEYIIKLLHHRFPHLTICNLNLMQMAEGEHEK